MDFSRQLEELEKRVQKCEQAVGGKDEEGERETTESLSRRVKEVAKETQDLFRREKSLHKYEQKTTMLSDWLKSENATVSDLVLHAVSKRQFVLQNAPYLRQFATNLAELKELEPSISPPSPPTIELQKGKLDRLEANQKVLATSVLSVHRGVTELCDDYNRVIDLISQQLIQWDKRM